MFRRTLLGSIWLVVVAPSLLIGADNTFWPQFRGPRRDDVSTDTGLLKAWPKNGPPLIWEAKGAGRGYSSVSMAGGRVYTLGDGPSTAR